MIFEKIGKKGLFFLGGMATTIVANTVLKSEKTRELAVKTLASGMKLQQDALYELETIREDAQDVLESNQRNSNDSEETNAN